VPGIDDMAVYWVDMDRKEKNNLVIPLVQAILKAQAAKGG
jgi:hypothetical protein